MKLENLFLKKEELPILHETCFQVPIHPKLLDESIKINEDIAENIFPEIAEEWYEDLTKYIETKNPEHKEQIKNIYLNKKPNITRELGHQFLNDYWRDDVQTTDNGFATCLSISRNGGGSIYFIESDSSCLGSLRNPYIKFSEEKIKEFEAKKIGNHSLAFSYSQHNVDYHPGALFLRNWAIKYMNEVFKEIF